MPWTRLAAIAALGLLGVAATSISSLALSAGTTAVGILVAASDRLPVSADHPARQPGRPGSTR